MPITAAIASARGATGRRRPPRPPARRCSARRPASTPSRSGPTSTCSKDELSAWRRAGDAFEVVGQLEEADRMLALATRRTRARPRSSPAVAQASRGRRALRWLPRGGAAAHPGRGGAHGPLVGGTRRAFPVGVGQEWARAPAISTGGGLALRRQRPDQGAVGRGLEDRRPRRVDGRQPRHQPAVGRRRRATTRCRRAVPASG